jgi:multidrug resistance efflux pump
MKQKKFNWYLIVCAAAFLSALILLYQYRISENLMGIVESKSHLLGAQESGTIRNLFVAVGENVKQGQVLVTLDLSDLERDRKQLLEELTSIRNLRGAQKDQLLIEFQRMGLQLDNEASEFSERLAILESQGTELAGLNAEIERLQKAEGAGLGHTRDLADLVLRRDALASYLKEQSKELQISNKKLTKTRQTRRALSTVDSDSVVKSMLLQSMERAADLEREISVIDYRMHLRTVLAPCDGYVVELLAGAGDVVQEFAPILSVEETNPRYLTVYIPEKSSLPLEIGAPVFVTSIRSKRFNTNGRVAFIDPGFSLIPERLSFRGQIFWARKVQVTLDERHALLPGEVVYAQINGKSGNSDSFSTAVHASQTIELKSNGHIQGPPLADMKVPEVLRRKSRFEPSGINWVPGIGKYLLVSDDTGLKDASNEHAPWLFTMDDTGLVDALPLILQGIDEVNDLEAIAAGDNGALYLVSSQNISKQDKRPINRETLLRVQYDGKAFTVQGKVAFLSLILDSYSKEQQEALGLKYEEKDQRPELNIEGAAYDGGALYLGLKEPLDKDGAIIWKLSSANSVFDGQKLSPGQLSVYGHVRLGEFKGMQASISDLAFDPKGRLWALSTIAGASTEDQIGGLHRIDRFADGRLESRQVLSFPKLKPEGICFRDMQHLFIVFDKDEAIPSFCVLAPEEL